MNFQLLALLAVTCLVSAVPIQQSPTSGVATVSVDADLPADFRLYGLARLPAITSFTLDNNNWEAPTGVTWRAQNTGPTPITYNVQFKSNVCTANDGFTFLLVDGAGTRSFIPNSGTGCSVSLTFADQGGADSDSVGNKTRGQVYLVRPFGFVPPSTSTTTTTSTTTRTTTTSTRTSTTTRTTTTSTSTRTSTTTRTTTTSTSTRTTTTSTTTRTSTSTTRTSTSTTRTSTSTTRTSTSTTRTSTSTTRTSTSTFSSTTFNPTTTGIPTTTAVPINFVNRRLNFLLNAKYLAAEYCLAGLGRSPSYSGSVNGTVNGGQAVNFTSPNYQGYANEICNDYEAHVVALRNFLGGAAINRPDLNINGGFNSTFSRAVRAAGVFAGLPNSTLAALGNFTPYANDVYFLLMASGLADVVAQAERNTFAGINNQNASGLLAGIFGTDSYHAGHLRALLYGRRNDIIVPASNETNSANVTLGQIYGIFAGWVNSLAGGNNSTNIPNALVDSDGNANIVPTGDGGSLNGYTPRQVLNILYGNASNSTNGLFFPNGFNGNLNGVL